MSRIRRFWKQTLAVVNKGAIWSDRHLPPGVRSGLGVLAMAGGVVGFLPVVGFWMLPLGVVLIARHPAVPPPRCARRASGIRTGQGQELARYDVGGKTSRPVKVRTLFFAARRRFSSAVPHVRRQPAGHWLTMTERSRCGA
jgi:hypothetical protein